MAHHSQCFASHQTIAPGDKCFALAIRQQSTYNTVKMSHKGEALEALGISHSAIYPDAYWTPVGNLIEGVYVGSGDIKVTENDENLRRLLVFVRLMLKHAAVVEQGENPSHDHPFNLPQYIENDAPSLHRYLGDHDKELTKEETAVLFSDLCNVWRHVDDVAFKHRVFYADQHRRMRPLQLTLMHRKCYEDLLGQVSDSYTPAALFEKQVSALLASSCAGALKDGPLSPDVRELYVAIAAREVLDVVESIGQFDSVRYHEEALGHGEFAVNFLEKKLTKAQLFKRLAPVTQDRLVVHMLESYKVKLQPKCIWHEDGKNGFGKGYADFIGRVSGAVTKSRRNKPSY